MAVLSKPFTVGLTALAALAGVSASPLATRIEKIKHLLKRDTFEWTAWGDSYSSGVGAGEYTSNSYRCLRYDQAYPNLMNGDARLPEGDHIFHNAVCSGSSTADVQAYQFYDEDTYGTPSFQYGDRPKVGSPSMGTLSVGGNDIDFPGIIFNCIIETHVWGGPPKISCDQQREVTWALLNDGATVDNIDKTIKKVVEKARAGPAGDSFKLYVTGFPQFFSDKTNECDTVTFARTANPNDDGAEHVRMTQELRKDFNAMSVKLNAVIEEAVNRNTDQGVKWISIDESVEGHRFCEPGVKEPDQQNTNLWLWHYPYNEPADQNVDTLLTDAFNRVSANVDINSAYTTDSSLENAVYEAIEAPDGQDASVAGFWDFLWRYVGARVKVFHPQVALHEKIRDLVLDAYLADLGANPPPPPPEPTTAPPEPTTAPPPPPPPPVSYSCKGSTLCGSTPNLRRDCDDTVNNLQRGHTYQYAASTDGVDEGFCMGGCGVFLEGPPDCKGWGDDLWHGYQEIREQGGCGTCGFKSFTGEEGGECKLKIDYVSSCKTGLEEGDATPFGIPRL